MNTQILFPTEQDIARAGALLRQGQLVAFPTETVYGLGANALDEAAVKQIYAAKGRPSDNPLIVHVANKADIAPLVKEIPPKAQALIDAFFPGPLTIILPKSDKIGKTVSGGLDTVAVRMPENKIANRVIAAAGVPIAAPSANTSGLPSPTKAKYVMEDMMGRIAAILDGGDCAFGVESTVITLATDRPTLLRPGAITREMLEQVIGKIDIASAVLEKMADEETAASPGMKYKHYAPKARVVLVKADKATYETFVNAQKDAFALCFDEDRITIPKVTFGKEGDDLSQARALFDALRQLDALGAKTVYARMPRKDGVGMAVYNRLIRAAAFTVIDLTLPFFIGLTGATGAGKGYVSDYLKTLGYHILDCDAYARKITQKNSPFLPVLAREFGEDIIEGGVLNRARLAERAFSSEENKARLNALLHPAILELCKKDAVFPAVLDAPQLFESGADRLCCKIIAVTAPQAVRKQRIMARDGLDEAAAALRMGAQLSEEYYIEHSDFTVVNDGRDIKSQINRILEAIT